MKSATLIATLTAILITVVVSAACHPTDPTDPAGDVPAGCPGWTPVHEVLPCADARSALPRAEALGAEYYVCAVAQAERICAREAVNWQPLDPEAPNYTLQRVWRMSRTWAKIAAVGFIVAVIWFVIWLVRRRA